MQTYGNADRRVARLRIKLRPGRQRTQRNCIFPRIPPWRDRGVGPWARLPVGPLARQPVGPSARGPVSPLALQPVGPSARGPVCPVARVSLCLSCPLPSDLGHPTSVLCPLPSDLGHPTSDICLLSSAIRPRTSDLRHLSSAFCPLSSAFCPLPSDIRPLRRCGDRLIEKGIGTPFGKSLHSGRCSLLRNYRQRRCYGQQSQQHQRHADQQRDDGVRAQ